MFSFYYYLELELVEATCTFSCSFTQEILLGLPFVSALGSQRLLELQSLSDGRSGQYDQNTIPRNGLHIFGNNVWYGNPLFGVLPPTASVFLHPWGS